MQTVTFRKAIRIGGQCEAEGFSVTLDCVRIDLSARDNEATMTAELATNPSAEWWDHFDVLKRLPTDRQVGADPRDMWELSLELIDELPISVAAYFGRIERQLDAAMLKATGVMRWRLNVDLEEHTTPIGYWWSLDGEVWRPSLEAVTFVPDLRSDAVVLEEVATRAIKELLHGGRAEPTGHSLLLEATQLCAANPRAALVLAVAASEIAVKDFIGDYSSVLQWIVFEMPSPPLKRLVREVLPQLTDERTTGGHVVPSELQRSLYWGVEERNRIVHRGSYSLDVALLYELLAATHDSCTSSIG